MTTLSQIPRCSGGAFSAIYLLRNTVNNKVYIGSAQNFHKRMWTYRNYKAHCLIQRALVKYTAKAFQVEILERNIPWWYLTQREQYYLDLYQPFEGTGYNVCRVAGAAKDKVTLSKKKRVISEAGRAAWSKSRIGRKATHSKYVLQKRDGVGINLFPSLHAAAKYVCCTVTALSAVCNKRKSYLTIKGFEWEFVEL